MTYASQAHHPCVINILTLNQRRTFWVAFGNVLVASRMYVTTSAFLLCYERVFITKKTAYFMISEFWTFGLQNLFVRTREPFFSNLRTFGLKNLRTHEPSNLRTFGLIGCNRPVLFYTLYSAILSIDLANNIELCQSFS